MDRQKAIEYIKNQFDVDSENLWASFPDYLVFRNQKNKKWFALIAGIEKDKLGLKGKERVSIINLKCDPILMGSLRKKEGYFPAYHMNKSSWISVLLDDSVSDDEIKDLICLSYEIIENKH